YYGVDAGCSSIVTNQYSQSRVPYFCLCYWRYSRSTLAGSRICKIQPEKSTDGTDGAVYSIQWLFSGCAGFLQPDRCQVFFGASAWRFFWHWGGCSRPDGERGKTGPGHIHDVCRTYGGQPRNGSACYLSWTSVGLALRISGGRYNRLTHYSFH